MAQMDNAGRKPGGVSTGTSTRSAWFRDPALGRADARFALSPAVRSQDAGLAARPGSWPGPRAATSTWALIKAQWPSVDRTGSDTFQSIPAVISATGEFLLARGCRRCGAVLHAESSAVVRAHDATGDRANRGVRGDARASGRPSGMDLGRRMDVGSAKTGATSYCGKRLGRACPDIPRRRAPS